jgi:hypothetical protein
MEALAVRCPQCHIRLCDRTPSGCATGHFRCRCRLELMIEYTAYSEVQLVIVPPELAADVAPFILKRTLDGRGLVTWVDYSARVLK